jgi:hypothetical protein
MREAKVADAEPEAGEIADPEPEAGEQMQNKDKEEVVMDEQEDDVAEDGDNDECVAVENEDDEKNDDANQAAQQQRNTRELVKRMRKIEDVTAILQLNKRIDCRLQSSFRLKPLSVDHLGAWDPQAHDWIANLGRRCGDRILGIEHKGHGAHFLFQRLSTALVLSNYDMIRRRQNASTLDETSALRSSLQEHSLARHA